MEPRFVSAPVASTQRCSRATNSPLYMRRVQLLRHYVRIHEAHTSLPQISYSSFANMDEAQTSLPHVDTGDLCFDHRLGREKRWGLPGAYRSYCCDIPLEKKKIDNVQHELQRRPLLLIRNIHIPREGKKIKEGEKGNPRKYYGGP